MVAGDVPSLAVEQPPASLMHEAISGGNFGCDFHERAVCS
jgi:hypothetical protein